MWMKKRWNKDMVKKLMPAIFLSVAVSFMLFIFAPLEIYAANTDEFWFDFRILCPFIIKDFFICCGVSIFAFFLFYLLGEVFYSLALYGYFVFFVVFYVHGNFLVSGLPPFDGTDVNWSLYSAETARSTIISVAIAIVLLVLNIVLKSKKFRTVISFASVFVFLMLGSTLAVLCISENVFAKKQFVKFTKDDQFEMSTDTNFIIFMLDAVDAECFWEVWEKHPEYEEAMADFTYYNNAMSGYAYTDHSLPLIISGEWYENKESYQDYIMRAYGDSPFLNHLKEEGFSLSFYEDDLQFEVGIMDGAFENMTYTQSSLYDGPLFNTRIIKMVGIKYAPYLLKPYCWFDPDKLNHQEFASDDEELFIWLNGAFYEDLKNDEITFVDEKRFKMIHLSGAHVPFRYDKDVNEVADADYYTSIESSMTVTMEYLNKLREAGAYDNSVILVLSDHGYNTSGDAVKIPQKDENQSGRQHPILFIKGLNESHDLQISGAPISYEDLLDSYFKLLDGNLSDNVFEYKEGDYRERRYLLYKYLGEDHMVEYVQNGYAGDEDTLVPTGRVFDLQK